MRLKMHFKNINKLETNRAEEIWFGLYGISNVVGYLMPNPVYTYVFDIYDL